MQVCSCYCNYVAESASQAYTAAPNRIEAFYGPMDYPLICVVRGHCRFKLLPYRLEAEARCSCILQADDWRKDAVRGQNMGTCFVVNIVLRSF